MKAPGYVIHKMSYDGDKLGDAKQLIIFHLLFMIFNYRLKIATAVEGGLAMTWVNAAAGDNSVSATGFLYENAKRTGR
jgi:hypothetical protein